MKKPLLVIVGPTASGKTVYSLEMAKHFPIEIISGDSAQIYHGMNIGTAKISVEDRNSVPHHMIDIVDPSEPFSAADFQREVKRIINEIHGRDHLPAIVGGTGLYIESIIYDYKFIEQPADAKIRNRLNALADTHGINLLYAMLNIQDPIAAARIHQNDRKRIIRALEILESTGAPLSKQQEKQAKESPYTLCMIGLEVERQQLYERIDKRVELMLEEGLQHEVEQLLLQGYSPQLISLQAIGYKEMVQYLRGKCSHEDMVTLIKRNSRRYAKRQLSWFRTMPQIQWVDVTNSGNFRTHCDAINDIITTMFPKPHVSFNSPRAQ
jgi:tRNA dimethylallyltransferase